MAAIGFGEEMGWVGRVMARIEAVAEAVTRRRDAGGMEDDGGVIRDMLERSPDAFRSEYDVQAMMHMYPGRY